MTKEKIKSKKVNINIIVVFVFLTYRHVGKLLKFILES